MPNSLDSWREPEEDLKPPRSKYCFDNKILDFIYTVMEISEVSSPFFVIRLYIPDPRSSCSTPS